MFIAFVRKEESGLRKLVSIVFIGSLLGICLFLIVNTLNKRSDREIKDDNNKPYITITETVSSEGNNPETKSNCYEYDIDPEDYETEDEYNAAVREAKYGWRDTCEDGSDYGINPEDYETEDEYLEALAEADEIF